MRLLFLLVFSPLVVAYCPSGHYKDDTFQKCVKCTPCHVIQTPCTQHKDAVCAPVNNAEAHHLKKKLIHFFDDTEDEDLDEDLHSKNFVSYDTYFPHEKEHHKKGVKHSKTKHEEKHHNKKKHFEFGEKDDEFGNYDNYDNPTFDEKLFSEKPKHKKHYEFSKKHKKKYDDFFSSEDTENEKLNYLFGKDKLKAKKKPTHHKKIDADEKTLEELLIQSKKKLKLQKDNLLKTLKEENGDHYKSNKKIRLNSPVFESDTEVYDHYKERKASKSKKHSDESTLKVLSDLKESDIDDEGDMTSFISYDEISKDVTSSQKISHIESSTESEIIRKVKTPEEVIRDEMGKNFIYEKPRFNVIPFVVGKEPTEKTSLFQKYHSLSSRKGYSWDDETTDGTENPLDEMKTHDVVSLPFTAAETLVWDWQAVAMASAVASCLVFFLVVAIYFVVNARQWKKVNKNYNREIEEMSTRIALMQPTFESGSPDSHTTSLYMENIVAPVKEEEKKDQKV